MEDDPHQYRDWYKPRPMRNELPHSELPRMPDLESPKRKWKMFGEHPKTNIAAVGTLLSALASIANSYAQGHPLDWSVIGVAVTAAYGLFSAADAKKS